MDEYKGAKRGRKRLPADKKRPKRKEIRFTKKEWDDIKQEAARQGKETAVLFRELIIEALVRVSRS